MKKEIVSKVKRILRKSSAARNSDSVLIARYLLNHTQLKSCDPKLKDIIFKALVYQMPTAETITRIRRKTQEDGYYQASSRTKKERKVKEGYCRSGFKGG